MLIMIRNLKFNMVSKHVDGDYKTYKSDVIEILSVVNYNKYKH